MPYKKKTTKRRVFPRRRKVVSNRKQTVNYSREPVAPRLFTKINYADEIGTFSLTGVTPNVYQYRLNSAYDPDSTSSGHQPYGFDQLATLYNRYRVYKVTGSLIVHTTSTTNIMCTILPANSATSYTNMSLAMESPYAVSKLCNVDRPAIFKFSYKPSLICGATKAQYNSDDRFQALTNTNPQEVINLHCLQRTTGADTSCIACVKLTYWCEFFDPHPLSQS